MGLGRRAGGLPSPYGGGSFPDQFGTLFIKAVFKTAGGKDLDGYLVGDRSFYAFCLFLGDHEHLINLNVPDLAAIELKALESALAGPILPLLYGMEVEFDDQPQINGVIEEIAMT